jgi:hypothetical protein
MEQALQTRQQEDINTRLNEIRPDATRTAIDSRIQEYQEYCDYRYENDVYRQVLCSAKMYDFLYYLMFREQKKRGGKRQNNNNTRFNAAEYATLREKLANSWASPLPTAQVS